jgi:glycosyltransferase involved in cell wall biosynthesis
VPNAHTALKVVIDVRPAGDSPAGIGQYVTNLVRALAALEDSPSLVLLGDRAVDGDSFPLGPKCQLLILPDGLGWHLRARKLFSSVQGDIYHAPSSALVPLALRRRAVLTVHDLAPAISPGVSTVKTRLAYLVLRLATRASGRVIAVSRATLERMEALWGKSDRTTVILEAPRPFPDCPSRERLDSILGGTAPYFLAVGTQEPRKNFERLVSAFEQASQGKEQFPRLVIAGKPGWGATPRFLETALERLSPNLLVLGFTTDRDLACLYRHARAFLIGSLDEGFGLPALEAMSFGSPVAASKRGALPEVLGKAPLYFDAEDEQEIGAVFRRLAHDDELCRELKRRSLKRAKLFSWASTASQTLEVYRSLRLELE